MLRMPIEIKKMIFAALTFGDELESKNGMR